MKTKNVWSLRGTKWYCCISFRTSNTQLRYAPVNIMITVTVLLEPLWCPIEHSVTFFFIGVFLPLKQCYLIPEWPWTHCVTGLLLALWSCYLCLSTSRTPGMCHHVQLVIFWKTNVGLCSCKVCTPSTDPCLQSNFALIIGYNSLLRLKAFIETTFYWTQFESLRFLLCKHMICVLEMARSPLEEN